MSHLEENLYRPHKEVSQFRFGKDHFKRVVTKENHVRWFLLTELFTWRQIESPLIFSKLETKRRELQHGI